MSRAPIRWSQDAELRLKKVPFFIRPFLERRAENVATERGLPEIDAALLDELKSQEHRG